MRSAGGWKQCYPKARNKRRQAAGDPRGALAEKLKEGGEMQEMRCSTCGKKVWVSSPDWYELGGGRRVVKGCRHFPKRTLVIETKKERG